jgi:pyridoxal phosphate enzyme (YggS family)
MTRLSDRLGAVEERIQNACRRAGRARSEVTLVAVTKTVSAEAAAELPNLGVLDLGENRPQELRRKMGALPPGVRWHLIGHLQRNKVEEMVPRAHCIHSLDSERLIEAVESEGRKQQRDILALLQVNVSGEASKHGFTPDEVLSLAPRLAELEQMRLHGLMTMAPLEGDPERCRPVFAGLRHVRDRLQRELGESQTLRHLSMGMSNDFEVAVEEGATLLRLGSVLFGEDEA